MADITKIKGSYISDIKARKSINSLYKYYSNLIRESNTQIKVLDSYNEFKDVITNTMYSYRVKIYDKVGNSTTTDVADSYAKNIDKVYRKVNE